MTGRERNDDLSETRYVPERRWDPPHAQRSRPETWAWRPIPAGRKQAVCAGAGERLCGGILWMFHSKGPITELKKFPNSRKGCSGKRRRVSVSCMPKLPW